MSSSSASFAWLGILLLAGASAVSHNDVDSQTSIENESAYRTTARRWVRALVESGEEGHYDDKIVRDAVAFIYQSLPLDLNFFAETEFIARAAHLRDVAFPDPRVNTMELLQRILLMDTTDGRTRAFSLVSLFETLSQRGGNQYVKRELSLIPKSRFIDAMECLFDILRSCGDHKSAISLNASRLVGAGAEVLLHRSFDLSEDHVLIIRRLLELALEHDDDLLGENVLRFCANSLVSRKGSWDAIGDLLGEVVNRGTISSEYFDYQSTYNAFFAVEENTFQALDPRWGRAMLLAKTLMA